MLGLTPPIFFVSSLLARKAKAASSGMERDALLKASGLGELEGYITDLLDKEGRVRIKLESPLGVVEELVRRYRESVGERMSLLEDDFKTSENVESQLELFQEDMRRDFEARMAEVGNIIHSLNERGDAWFEDNIRIGNVAELVRRERIQERFQREVIGDTEALIDERVDELVDWMVDRNLKQWRDIVEYVNRRRQAQYNEHLIGEVGDNFEYNRSQGHPLRRQERHRRGPQLRPRTRIRADSPLPPRRRCPDPGRRGRGFGPWNRGRDGRDGRRGGRDHDPLGASSGGTWLLYHPEPAAQGPRRVSGEDRHAPGETGRGGNAPVPRRSLPAPWSGCGRP